MIFITGSVGFSAHRFYIAAAAPSLARLIATAANSDMNCSTDIGTRSSSDCSMVITNKTEIEIERLSTGANDPFKFSFVPGEQRGRHISVGKQLSRRDGMFAGRRQKSLLASLQPDQRETETSLQLPGSVLDPA